MIVLVTCGGYRKTQGVVVSTCRGQEGATILGNVDTQKTLPGGSGGNPKKKFLASFSPDFETAPGLVPRGFFIVCTRSLVSVTLLVGVPPVPAGEAVAGPRGGGVGRGERR